MADVVNGHVPHLCKFFKKLVNVFHTSPLGYLSDPLSIGLLRAGSLGSYGLGLLRGNNQSFYFVGPEVRVRKYGIAGTSRSVTSLQKKLKCGQKKYRHFVIEGMKKIENICFQYSKKKRSMSWGTLSLRLPLRSMGVAFIQCG